jgi:hypothetical protein
MAPCLLGYGAVAKMLHGHDRTDKSEANTYWPWIENYVADDYVEAVRLGSGKTPLQKFSILFLDVCLVKFWFNLPLPLP